MGLRTPAGLANRNEFTLKLSESDTPPNYIVTITNSNGLPFFFDAVTPVLATDVLTAGLYDDDHPSIIYERDATNLVLNGDMERLNIADPLFEYWSDIGSPTTQRFAAINYRPSFSWQVQTSNPGDGIQSRAFTLSDGEQYHFIAHIFIPPIAPGTVTVSIVDLDGPSTLFTEDVTTTGRWIPVQTRFIQTGDLSNVVVQVTSTAGNFFVDDVELMEDSDWQAVFAPALYFGNFAHP